MTRRSCNLYRKKMHSQNYEELKKYVCLAPWKDFYIYPEATAVCCPEWMDGEAIAKEWIDPVDNFPQYACGKVKNHEDVRSKWNDDFMKSFRESTTNGSFKYCSQKYCPYLSRIVNRSDVDRIVDVRSEHIVTQSTWKNIKSHYVSSEEMPWTSKDPKKIHFDFDRSCNLACPSCRLEVVPNQKNDYVEKIIESLDRQFCDSVESFLLSGSGDPFYSNPFRTFLQNLDLRKYPRLKEIFIVTNGNLLTERMWATMPHIHHLINGLEISIDAATQETYEKKVRLNGRWNVLMKNMLFLAKRFTLKHFVVSFVIQDHNVEEIYPFYLLIKEIMKDRPKGTDYQIEYRAIQNWRHQSDEWMRQRDVAHPDHPKHQILIDQLNKIGTRKNVHHNLWHLVSKDPNEIEGELKQRWRPALKKIASLMGL